MLFRLIARKKIVDSYQSKNRRLGLAWICQRTERSNFYYHLTDMNNEDLVSLISIVTGISRPTLRGYLKEILNDSRLNAHLEKYLHSRPETRDSIVAFGRRIGWYIFIRAVKPSLVVETGVHHGVGACVIASALLRNSEEGNRGRYIGTEIDRSSGFLFSEPYSSVGEIRFGDSITTLSGIRDTVDIFINDSDHSEEYEAREYEEIKKKLADNSIILGDNSHVTGCLREFSEKNNRSYLFFKELPKGHWYPGGGIGVSFSQIN